MPKDKALTSEDRILWGKVARSTRAMPGKLDALTEFEAVFAEKIEERIKARLYAEFPNLKSRRNDIVLSFIIQGTFHTIATSAGKEVPDSEDLETIARLTDHIITELKPADE